MNDVMLDFETFGTGPNACICQVGAVYFDKATGELGKEYKANINAESSMFFGGKVNASTIYFWLQQSDAARKSITEGEKRSLFDVLVELNEFLKDAKRVWSHATFDFVILMNAFKQINMKPSISYKSGLDLRTLVYLAGVKVDKTEREGTHHDALDDCKHQVKYCVKSLNAIRTNKKLINLIEGLKDE